MRLPHSSGNTRWRCYVDGPAPQTDAPERLYRTDGKYFTWDDLELVDDTPRIRPTALDGIATSVLLNYGWHEPTKSFARSLHVSPTSNNLLTSGSTYQTAMEALSRLAGVSRLSIPTQRDVEAYEAAAGREPFESGGR